MNTIMKLLFTTCLIISSLLSFAQIQKGQDIDGLTRRDNCGQEVAISNYGNVIAVSSHFNNTAGYDAGMVRVFDYSGTSWIQRGPSLLGDTVDDAFGLAIDLNADGTVLAVGVPYAEANRDNSGTPHGLVKIYSWDGTNWNQRGNSIIGSNTQWLFGQAINLDASGNRIAVGSNGDLFPNVVKDEVKVYDWDGTNWVKFGNTIQGEANFDDFGKAVSLSRSGNTLAVGAPSNKGNTANTSVGHTRIYELVGTTWTKVGADIDGTMVGNSESSGSAVAINDSGNVVVIGATGNNTNGFGAGHASVYRFNGTSWVQKGADLNGEAAGDAFGVAVSMDASGNSIAIGGRNNDGSGSDAGHVRVFRWVNGAWLQDGNDIDGEGQFDESGTGVALDSTGNTVIIGAPKNSNAINFSGHARVYDFGNPVNIKELTKNNYVCSISPNPFDKRFIIDFQNVVRKEVKVRDAKGNIVYSEIVNNKSQLSVELNVKSGLYYVEVSTNSGQEVHKIIKL